jgi:Histidine kinase-, DNA gyrase B-, and HSP90-like ATPase
MASEIESELRRRCRDNENFRILLAQWEYDRQLFERALNTIGHAFPHYSLHDASHSETILKRISNVLGSKSISRLSATDLWLMLEAAYIHDAGMVALDHTKRKDINSPEFHHHIVKLQHGEDVDLSQSAQRLIARGSWSGFGDVLDRQRDLILVYADYTRILHAARSYDIALNPSERTAVASPRTSLIPNRLWHTIGQICRAHGVSRDEAMKISARESGIANDICHPRFVAFMLRLGDLLDLDSGRFCPILNSTIGNMPQTSRAHMGKHEGTCHLLVDTTRIEVTGKYQKIEDYIEAENWFSWLKEELGAQLLHWDQIAPSCKIGSLPSLGRIEARLEGQVIYDRNVGPRFGIDRQKILELVQGANLYQGPGDVIREALQNAVDATLLRLSYERQSAGLSKPRDFEHLRKLLSHYPIKIKISLASSTDQQGHAKSPVQSTPLLKISIEDSGIGLRQQDLKFLLHVASTSKNHYKRYLSDWLPEWARPSGAFGIGFHSLFAFCSKVTLTTRHPEDDSGLTVDVIKKEGEREPIVVIRPLKRPSVGFPRPAGTILEAYFDRPNDFLEENQIHYADSLSESKLDYFFMGNHRPEVIILAVRDTIADIAEYGPCTIKINNTRTSDLPQAFGKENLFEEFDTDTNTRIIFHDALAHQGAIYSCYRGAPVGYPVPSNIVTFTVDIYNSNAKELLELSRNDWTAQGNAFVERCAKETIPKYVPKWLSSLRNQQKQTSAQQPKEDTNESILHSSLGPLSLYAILNDLDEAGSEWESVFVNESESLKVSNATRITFGQIAAAKKARITIGPSLDEEPVATDPDDTEFRASSASANAEPGTLVFADTSKASSRQRSVLYRFLHKVFRRKIRFQHGDHSSYLLEKSDTDYEDTSDAAIKSDLLRFLQSDYAHRYAARPTAITCPWKYRSLSSNFEMQSPLQSAYNSSVRSLLMSHTMIVPYIFHSGTIIIGNLSNYIDYIVQKNGISRSEAASSLMDFMSHVETLMASQKEWQEAKKYDFARANERLSGMRSRTSK